VQILLAISQPSGIVEVDGSSSRYTPMHIHPRPGTHRGHARNPIRRNNASRSDTHCFSVQAGIEFAAQPERPLVTVLGPDD
jgi:hypothetical protein